MSSQVQQQAASPISSKYGNLPLNIAPGDRTHIPKDQQLIFKQYSEILGQLQQNIKPPQRRIIQDIEKRLNDLFDNMNNGVVVDVGLVSGLRDIGTMMGKRDWGGALGVHVGLSTTYMGIGSVWLIGIKRMIDLGKVMLG